MKFSVFKSCGWRRQLAVLLVFVMVLQLSVAAGAQEKAARSAETITDQANREVSVRFPSERIVCLQHHSLDIMSGAVSESEQRRGSGAGQLALGDHYRHGCRTPDCGAQRCRSDENGGSRAMASDEHAGRGLCPGRNLTWYVAPCEPYGKLLQSSKMQPDTTPAVRLNL